MELILFRGRPGTGKTFYSDLLSKDQNTPVLRKDDIYDAISVFINDQQNRNNTAYTILYKVLKTNVNTNSRLILDFPFQVKKDIENFRNWCLSNQIHLISVLVTCSDQVLWAARFNERSIEPKPNQQITNFEDLKKYYSQMYIEAYPGELVIDTANHFSNNINEIKQFINGF